MIISPTKVSIYMKMM